MGTYGIGIEDDDLTKEVVNRYIDLLKTKFTYDDAKRIILEEYADSLSDADEEPLIYIGLAKVQWDYGVFDDLVFEKVIDDFKNKRGLSRWIEVGDDAYNKRLEVLEKFIMKLSQINPKPKKIPRLTIRKPLFKRGDCLSIEFLNNRFAAFLVLDDDFTNVEYGQSLMILIDYCSSDAPTIDVYENPVFLKKVLNNTIPGPEFYEKQGRSDHKYYVFWIQRIGFRAISKKVITPT